MKKALNYIIIFSSFLILSGCSTVIIPKVSDSSSNFDMEILEIEEFSETPDNSDVSDKSDISEKTNATAQINSANTANTADMLDINDIPAELEDDSEEDSDNTISEPISFYFRDVFGEEYETVLNPEIPVCPFDKEKFVHEDYKVFYEDEFYVSRLGIDVSRHVGKINWKEIVEEGYEFAIIRLGYRSYGKNAGDLYLDKNFLTNILGAKEIGLDVGVYIYSQAINEQEAIEEADFVIDNLENNGITIDLPIVYDPESVLNDDARTDDVTPEQFTMNSIAFCNRVRERGYSPMIYANMLWEAYEIDFSKIPDTPIWYADYEEVPQTPYMFSFWQYTNEGRVKGVHDAAVDIDIEMIPK